MLQTSDAELQILLAAKNVARSVIVGTEKNPDIITNTEFWTWFAFQCTVMVVGGIGNTWAFASIILNEKLQNTANTLFAIQAANDDILLLFSLPITLSCAAAHRSKFYVPEWMCDIDVYIRLVFASASPLGQAYTAVNQFMAVFWPVKYRLVFGRRRRVTLTCLCGVWGFAALYQLLQLLHIVGSSLRLSQQGICVWSLNNQRFEEATALTFTVLPFTVMIACYTMIFTKLRTTKDALLRRSVAHRAEGSLMMFASSLSYFATILPGTIYLNLQYDGQKPPNKELLILWSFTLIYVNFAVNSVFYAVLNRRIRQSMHCSLYIFLQKMNLVRLCCGLSITPALLDSNNFPRSRQFQLLREQAQRVLHREHQAGESRVAERLRTCSTPSTLLASTVMSETYAERELQAEIY